MALTATGPNGTNGVDYQTHVMHQLGHASKLIHFTAGQDPNCLMYNYNTAGRTRYWCNGEVYMLANAYAAPGTVQNGIVYAPPLTEVE